MNFFQRQDDLRDRLLGFCLVVLFHVAVVYALLTGLDKRVVTTLDKPIEVKVIEDVAERPPTKLSALPIPVFEAPPAPLIAPPKVRIAAVPSAPKPSPRSAPRPAPTPLQAPEPAPAPTPVAVSPTLAPMAPPTAPPAPPAPPVVPVPVPAAAPRSAALPEPATAGVVCSNYKTVMGDVAYPREAVRQGIEQGDAVIQFTLAASGEVKDIKAIRASNPIFARNSIRIVAQYKCEGRGRDETVIVPFGYRLQ